jgi:hypothetical protein
MNVRRLLLLGAVIALVVNRRRLRAAVIRWTGTNVHTTTSGSHPT